MERVVFPMVEVVHISLRVGQELTDAGLVSLNNGHVQVTPVRRIRHKGEREKSKRVRKVKVAGR